MIEELISLTEKQRQKMFSRKKYIEGDFVSTASFSIGKVEYINKKDKVALINLGETREVESVKNIKLLSSKEFEELKKEWLEKKLFPKTHQQRLSVLKKILLFVYPEERFEITSYGDSRFRVIIHYPEIEIRNSLDMSHTIRDLYFSLEVRFSGEIVHISEFSLARTTFEEREYNGNGFYIFSHIRDNSNPLYLFNRNFCFGSTSLDRLVSRLKSGVPSVFELKKFFLAMNNYFSWESLEGTPYHHMSNIGKRMYQQADIDFSLPSSREIINTETDKIIEKMENFNFKIDFLGEDWYADIINVNGGSTLEKFIEENIDPSTLSQEMFCYLVKGNYVRNLVPEFRDELRELERSERLAGFSFKGKNPKLNIIYEDISLHPQKVVNFSVYKEIKFAIINKFKTYLILNNES